MRPQSNNESIDPLEQAVVDNSLIFVGVDFVFAFKSLLMNLVLLCTDERLLVYIWVDFDVRVVTQFECILKVSALI